MSSIELMDPKMDAGMNKDNFRRIEFDDEVKVKLILT